MIESSPLRVHRDRRPRTALRRTLAATLAAAALALTAASLGTLACGGRDPGPDPFAGVDPDLVDPALRDLARWQVAALTGPPPAAPHAGAIRQYYRVRQDLMIPSRHAAARDTFWQRWLPDPRHILWLELAEFRGRFLADRSPVDSIFASIVAADSTHPAALQIATRRGWDESAEAREAYLAGADRAAALPTLSRLWFENRLLVVHRLHADLEGGLARAARTLPEAWREGGAPLAMCWWFEISQLARSGGRLDDAVLAAEVAGLCAEAAGDTILALRAHLERARNSYQRAEFDAAHAALAAADRLASPARHPRWLRDVRLLAAWIREDAGDLPGALATTRRARDLAVATADTQGMITLGFGVAILHQDMGVPDSARVWYDRSERLIDLVGREDLRARAQALRIANEVLLGNYDRADSLRALVTRGGNATAQRIMLFSLIEQGLGAHRPDLAYRGLAAARRSPALLLQDRGYNPRSALAALAAQLHASQGEFQLARRELEVIAAEATPGDVYEQYRLWHGRGRVAELAGDLEAAAADYRRAYDLARAAGLASKTSVARIRLGEVLVASGETAAAHDLLTSALDSPEYWARFTSALLLGSAAARGGDHAQARAHLDAAEDMLRPDAPAGLRARLRLEQARVLAATGHARAAWDHLDAIVLDPERVRNWEKAEVYQAFHRPLRREVAEARLALLADHPGLAPGDPVLAGLAEAAAVRWRLDPTQPGPEPAALAAAARAATGPLVAYFVGERRSWGWFTRDGAWRRFELPDRARLDGLVRAVQTDLDAPGRAVDAGAARELADLLLGPVAAAWPAGATLGLMTPAPLDALPWPALPLGAGQAIDRGPIVHLADLDPRAGARSASPAGALLALGYDDPGGGRPLRGPEAEAHAIAAVWPGESATALTGPAATWSALSARDLGAVQALHVASHASVAEGLPGQSTLRLAGAGAEPITIPDVRELALGADLVYLSACEGSRVVLDNGTGLGSFARAFLQAGAGAVVASTRRVDDAAAVELARAFYARWADGGGLAAALRAAQLAVRDGADGWRHPYYWAHYQLHLGGHAPAAAAR